MSARKPTPFPIRSLAQLESLAAPTRQEILDALQVSGPATVAEIGAALGRAPDSLYHHLRILEEVGLVKRSARESMASRGEAVFNLPSHDMRLAYDLRDPDKVEAAVAIVRSMSRIAYRDFDRAMQSGEVDIEGPRRNLRGARIKGKLDAAQIEELNRLYHRISEIMETPPRDRENARLHAVTFLMSPVPPSRRASGGEKD